MKYIFILLFLFLSACGGGGGNSQSNIKPDVDLVLYQNGYGTGACNYQRFTQERKNIDYGNQVWTDIELRHWFTTDKCFTYDEISNSIDDALTVTGDVIGYSIDCINDSNYDSRMENIFIYSNSNEQKLYKYPFETIVIQYYKYFNAKGNLLMDNSQMTNNLVGSNQFNIYVGLYSYKDWWTNEKLPELLKMNTKLIKEIYSKYGNQIAGIYIPQEFRVIDKPKNLFQYFNKLSKLAHSFGYKVAISPYCAR